MYIEATSAADPDPGLFRDRIWPSVLLRLKNLKLFTKKGPEGKPISR
jgi:hypothetical protein